MFLILIQLAFLTYQTSSKIINSKVYEFCAENQLYSFSYEACPGGVLLRTPLQLTEPCHCISNDLAVYSVCNPDVEPFSPYPTKTCQNDTNSDEIFLTLLQPFGNIEYDEKSVRHLRKDKQCTQSRSKCAGLTTNSSALTRLPRFDFHSPALELEPNYPKEILYSPGGRTGKPKPTRKKRDLSEITDADLRERIEQTINYFNELQSGDELKIKKQDSMSFEMLARTVKIFNYITPSIIVEDETMTALLQLFVQKYKKLELPSHTGKLTIDENVDEKIFEEVMSRLHECASKASDTSSQEFEFAVKPDVCPVQVTHVIDKVVRPDGSVKKRQLELHKEIPEDRKYVAEKEDLILAALWKVFDSVYTYCFPYLFAYQNAQALIYYYNIMEHIFISPWISMDFFSEDNTGTSTYVPRVEHEDLLVLMNNLDAMNEAVHMVGRYKQFFLKPVKADESSEETTTEPSITSPKPIKPQPSSTAPKAAPKPSTATKPTNAPTPSTVTKSTNAPTPSTATKPAKTSRKKRSPEDADVWADLQIWNGQAFCLQTYDPYLPTSIPNTHPSIDDMCL